MTAEPVYYHRVVAEIQIFHPEDHARAQIDDRLAAAGWLVQSRAQMALGAGAGVAVREFATGAWPVDYALFVGRVLCGVIEAKPAGTTLSGFADQAARYIADVPEHLVRREFKIADWIIDLGPEGDDGGGEIIAAGTPEDIVREKRSYTGQFLAPALARQTPRGRKRAVAAQ